MIAIIANTKTSKALNAQKVITNYSLPFTLNPCIGCPFACKYFFSPLALQKEREEFFNKVEIKLNLPAILDKELEKFKALPQHLKRVQINESNDIYHPLVLHGMQNKLKRDIMMEILDIFQKHWNTGNYWMLHILTKSHMILEHIEKLKEMRHMVQVELSLASLDEGVIRKIEMYTPSVKKRLETIEKLSSEGIFVRVMAMPCYEENKDRIIEFRSRVLSSGARAFKHKKLNYFSWENVLNVSYEDLLKENLPRTGNRRDESYTDLMLKSGERVLDNGIPRMAEVLLPVKSAGVWAALTKMSERLSLQQQAVIDSGYSELNSINWNYII